MWIQKYFSYLLTIILKVNSKYEGYWEIGALLISSGGQFSSAHYLAHFLGCYCDNVPAPFVCSNSMALPTKLSSCHHIQRNPYYPSLTQSPQLQIVYHHSLAQICCSLHKPTVLLLVFASDLIPPPTNILFCMLRCLRSVRDQLYL